MIRMWNSLCVAVLAGLFGATPTLADVTVRLDAQNSVVPTVGGGAAF